MVYSFDIVSLLDAISVDCFALWCWWNTGIVKHDWWFGEAALDSDAR